MGCMRAREEQLTAFAYDTVHLQRLGAVIECGPGVPAHGRDDLQVGSRYRPY